MNLYEKLCAIAGEENVLQDEPMSGHTTFRIGGPADFFVTPSKAEEIRRIIELCRAEKVPYYVVGNGSNLLVGDKGYRGVIIQIYKKMNRISVAGEEISVQAGALLSKVAAAACEAELEGMEFASGIPGTMGGAVRMNAGAYGGEMKQVLKTAVVLTPEGQIVTIPAEEMGMGYRTSIVSKMDYVVLEAVLSLKRGRKAEIRARMDELREKRVEKQPLEYGSAGSTFKRPEGYFAGKLIQDAGLRGFRIGNAQVSEKHCGFVINLGGATAAEVSELMTEVVRRVEETSGVTLKPEVKRIGEF
ncbi:UDP-N-acetylmuramate dehydrogenase [Mediterraneibacter glycyrrhizinilyticus]|nr:UDP-N-acetylmuramate dehydrogenase [Mediterraneibacter glycyrrhizinilyticus]MBM6854331.1 UDP-N-acetylmuramate dehydrogenase [Mediterraneibacter glycyrrhizinilyticus]